MIFSFLSSVGASVELVPVPEEASLPESLEDGVPPESLEEGVTPESLEEGVTLESLEEGVTLESLEEGAKELSDAGVDWVSELPAGATEELVGVPPQEPRARPSKAKMIFLFMG